MKRIIAVILTGLLLFSFVACIRISGLSCSVPVRYTDANKYTAGNFTYESDKVEKVEIDWMSGSITLLNGTGTLSVTESGADSLPENAQMHWWLDGKTLKIKFCKSGYKYELTDAFNEKKDLTIELPDFVDLDIDLASGKVSAENMLNLGTFRLDKASGGTDIRYLSAKSVKVDSASGGTTFGKVSVSGEFEVDSASGGLSVEEIAAKEIDVNSASGGIVFGRITGEKVDVDSASGSVTLGILSASKVKISSTSGGVNLTLADRNAGARIKFDAVSGSFNTVLPYEKDGSVYTIGSGRMDAEISVVSGSVTVD